MLPQLNEIWMKYHLVSDNNCNIVNLQCPIFLFFSDKDKHIMSGFHFVLVTLHGRFTITIE
jgi:hypothetical protein